MDGASDQSLSHIIFGKSQRVPYAIRSPDVLWTADASVVTAFAK